MAPTAEVLKPSPIRLLSIPRCRFRDALPFDLSLVALFLTAKLRYLLVTKNQERRERSRGAERKIVMSKPLRRIAAFAPRTNCKSAYAALIILREVNELPKTPPIAEFW